MYVYKFNLFVSYICINYAHCLRPKCDSRTEIKVVFLNFNLFLSVMLDSLCCSFTSIFFLTNVFIVTVNNMVVNSFIGRGNWSTQEKHTDRPQVTDKLLQKVACSMHIDMDWESHHSCL
jgi:hypothetical protein